MRATIRLVSAAAIVVAIFALGTPTANAAATTVSVNCQTVPTLRINLSPSSITADTSDTITLSVSGPFNFSVVATGASGASTVSGTIGPETYTVTGNSGGSLVLTGTNAGCNGLSATLTFSGSAPAPSPAGNPVSGPASIVQQFGKLNVGTCEVAAPESLNWSGVASGGWGESWAEWMNGGNGGAVCTRTLVYSTAQSRWVVG